MNRRRLPIDGLTGQIIGAAIEVHRQLGPGLLESTYQRCLVHELSLRRIPVSAEVQLDLRYKGLVVPGGYRMDLLVDDRVVVEVKAVDKLAPVHEAQLLTYLRLSRRTIGLIINFQVPLLKDGIVRKVLRHPEGGSPPPRPLCAPASLRQKTSG